MPRWVRKAGHLMSLVKLQPIMIRALKSGAIPALRLGGSMSENQGINKISQDRVHVIVGRKMQDMPAQIHLSNLTSQKKIKEG